MRERAPSFWWWKLARGDIQQWSELRWYIRNNSHSDLGKFNAWWVRIAGGIIQHQIRHFQNDWVFWPRTSHSRSFKIWKSFILCQSTRTKFWVKTQVSIDFPSPEIMRVWYTTGPIRAPLTWQPLLGPYISQGYPNSKWIFPRQFLRNSNLSCDQKWKLYLAKQSISKYCKTMDYWSSKVSYYFEGLGYSLCAPWIISGNCFYVDTGPRHWAEIPRCFFL